MKTKMITLMVVFAMMVSPVFAADPTISLEATGLTLKINVDDSTDIGGAAFTLKYDDTALSVSEITSPLFDTFVAQGFTAGQDGLGGDGQVDGLDAPLVSNNVSGIGTLIAAASAVPSDGTETTLFNVVFQAAEGADGEYTVEVVATELNNTAAGYAETGEVIPLLVSGQDTYPVLLDKDDNDKTKVYATGTVETTVIESGDANGDGLVNANDVIAVINHIFSPNKLDDAGQIAADMSPAPNGDGNIDANDIVALINKIFN